MKFFDVEQSSSEWFELRKGVPTASRFDKILTPKTRKLSAQIDGLIADLIGERFGMIPEDGIENATNRAMRWGSMCEAEARRFYSMEKNVEVTNGGFCLTDDGRFGTSPDGLIGSEGAIEIKCPQAGTHAGYLLRGEVPAEYLPQTHGHLIVTGRPWVDWLSYAPGLPPLLIRVTPDDFTDKLREALEEFWDRYQAALTSVGMMMKGEEP